MWTRVITRAMFAGGALLACGTAPALEDLPNGYLSIVGELKTTPFAGSGVSLRDNEGSAIVPGDGALWLADDSRQWLVEIHLRSGALRRVIDGEALAATVELGGAATAGEERTGDLEALAYDPLNDQLFAFSGPCCGSVGHIPTAFRLTRQGGQFVPESFVTLPVGSDFSGAAADPLTGELWVAAKKKLSLYDYASNTLGDTLSLDSVSGYIQGLGFTPDGRDLLMVTSAERLYRMDWQTKALRPEYRLSVPQVRDTRSVEIDGEDIVIGDGHDGAVGTDTFLSVYRLNLLEGFPPEAWPSSPYQGEVLQGTLEVTGQAVDDVSIESVRVTVRDRRSGLYLRPGGTWGSPHRFDAAMDPPSGPSAAFAWSTDLPPGGFSVTVEVRDGQQLLYKLPRTDVTVPSALDGVAPTSSVTSPLPGESVAAPVTIEGTASDDRSVSSVRFILRDRNTSLYLQPDGSFGKAKYMKVPVTTPGQPSSSFAWSPPSLGVGSYFVDMQARDAAGNLETDRQRVYFAVHGS